MTLTLWSLATLTVLAALGVALSRNPLSSALCLIVLLCLVAGHFALLEAHFLAAIQLLIYAGAVMVLVIFVIMLMGIEEEQRAFSLPAGLIALIAALGSIFLAFLFYALASSPIVSGALGATGLSASFGSAEAVGEVLFTKYIWPFLLCGMLMLGAMLGSVYLAQTTKRQLPSGRGLRALRERLSKEVARDV